MQVTAIFAGNSAVGLGSAQLLARFAATRDEAAFEALVTHHGPMVLATCRRILPERADADDAFQATFLVLARKAGSIADPDRLAPWLHGVARRVATRARTQSSQRLGGDGDGADLDAITVDPPPADAGELRTILDDELARLPAKYRDPLVLCYLEGCTQDEAARQLAWPVGTVRSRLAGGRDRLRARLARRGFAPGALAVLSPAALPSVVVSRPLLVATVRLTGLSGAGRLAGPAGLLAQGVLSSMFMTQAQTLALSLTLGATLIIATASVVARQQPAADPKLVPHPAAVPGQADEVFMPPTTADLTAAIARIRELETELNAVLKRAEPVPLSSLKFQPAKLPAPPVASADAKQRLAELSQQLTAIQREVKALDAALNTPSPPPNASQPQLTPALTQTATASSRADSRPEVRTIPNSSLLMVLSAERDRVTMVNPTTQQRAILRLDKPVVRIEANESKSGGPNSRISWINLDLEGPEITKLAVFEETTMTWHEHALSRPVTCALSHVASNKNRVSFQLEGKNVAEAITFNPESATWISEPLQGGPQQRLMTMIDSASGTVAFQAGRFFYFLSHEEPRWTVLEVKQTPVYDSQTTQVVAFNRVVTMPGLHRLTDGSLFVQDGDQLIMYNPRTAELTRIDTATAK